MTGRLPLLGLILTACSTVLLAPRHAAADAAQNKMEDPATRFCEAIQHRDFAAIYQLTFRFQQNVASIRNSRPKVMWARLEAAAEKDAERTFQETASPDLYGELPSLLMHECDVKVIESRTGRALDQPITTKFVQIDYMSPADSPLVEAGFLKQTIVQLIFCDAPLRGDQLFSTLPFGGARVPESDVVWDKTPPRIVCASAEYSGPVPNHLDVTFRGGNAPLTLTLYVNGRISDSRTIEKKSPDAVAVALI